MEDSKSVPVVSPIRQNEPPTTVGCHTQQSEPIGDKNRITRMDLRKGRLCWSRKSVWWPANRGIWERSVCVGRRHLVGDGEAEVEERSRDIGVEV
jgi:hypothetical protein